MKIKIKNKLEGNKKLLIEGWNWKEKTLTKWQKNQSNGD
jgi:hypothetical protein